MSPTLPLPSEGLYNAQFDRARTLVPAGKKLALQGTVTKEGATGTVAVKPWGNFQIEGWTQKQWGAKGWTAGARATFVW